MGISIHYKGKLDDLSNITDLMDELEDIANSIGWKCTRLDDDWDKPCNARIQHSTRGAKITGNLGLKGIILHPSDNTEILPFLFKSQGNMTSMIGALNKHPYDKIVSLKTQFGYNNTHIWIIGLLKYIQSKYVSNLVVTDEGGIWEGGSENQLRKKKAFVSGAIDSFIVKLTQTNLKNRNLPDLIKEIEKIAKDIHTKSQKSDPSQNEKCD